MLNRNDDQHCRKRAKCGHLKKVWFQTVQELNKDYPLAGMQNLCGLFGKTRQAYYEASWREEKVVNEQELVIKEVKRIREDLPRVGTDKLYFLLTDFFTVNQMEHSCSCNGQRQAICTFEST